MNEADVLVLNGSPGSGKSTLADAISRELLNLNIKHAVIDLDTFACVYPEEIDVLSNLKWANLAAVWPNYMAFGGLKVIIPVVIDTAAGLEALRNATPAKRFTICDLTAPIELLKERVTAREPDEYWRSKLRGLVDKYHEKEDINHFGDFEVSTGKDSVKDTARNIANKMGWLT